MKFWHWLPILILSSLTLAPAQAGDCNPTAESKTATFKGCGFGYVRLVSRIAKDPMSLTRREHEKIRLGHASLKEGVYNLITGVDKFDTMSDFPGSFVAKITFSGFPYAAFVEFADSYSATSFVAEIRAGGKHVDLSDCANEVPGLVCYKSDPAPKTFSELDFNGYSVRIFGASYGYDIRGKRLATASEIAAQRESDEDLPYNARGPAAAHARKTSPSKEENAALTAPGAPLGL